MKYLRYFRNYIQNRSIIRQRSDKVYLVAYACDVDQLQKYLPENLRPDVFEGNAWFVLKLKDNFTTYLKFLPFVKLFKNQKSFDVLALTKYQNIPCFYSLKSVSFSSRYLNYIFKRMGIQKVLATIKTLSDNQTDFYTIEDIDTDFKVSIGFSNNGTTVDINDKSWTYWMINRSAVLFDTDNGLNFIQYVYSFETIEEINFKTYSNDFLLEIDGITDQAPICIKVKDLDIQIMKPQEVSTEL